MNPVRINCVDCVWNVMAHAQKPDFVFGRNGRVHLIRQGREFSRLLAAEVCVSAVVMLDTPCSEVVWRVLATNSIRQFPLPFPSPTSPCAITFQLDSTSWEHLFDRLQIGGFRRDSFVPHLNHFSSKGNISAINIKFSFASIQRDRTSFYFTTL